MEPFGKMITNEIILVFIGNREQQQRFVSGPYPGLTSVNYCLFRDIVLQLSINCKNGGLINPKKSLQNIGFLKASEKEDKREEASHHYRPGKLFEIVFSLSRTEISMVRLRGNILTSNIVQVPQKQLASLKTWASIWKLEYSLQKLSVRHGLQKPP